MQTKMADRVRTVTIGNARLITNAQATDVAKRILLRAQTGDTGAETAKRIRSSPRFDVFLEEFWQKVAIQWKPSTIASHDISRRIYLDNAFPVVLLTRSRKPRCSNGLKRVTDRAGQVPETVASNWYALCSTRQKAGVTATNVQTPVAVSGPTANANFNVSSQQMNWRNLERCSKS